EVGNRHAHAAGKGHRVRQQLAQQRAVALEDMHYRCSTLVRAGDYQVGAAEDHIDLAAIVAAGVGLAGGQQEVWHAVVVDVARGRHVEEAVHVGDGAERETVCAVKRAGIESGGEGARVAKHYVGLPALRAAGGGAGRAGYDVIETVAVEV